MHLTRTILCVAIAATGASRPIGAQDPDARYAERGPQFLTTSSANGRRVRVDVAKTPVLRQRLSVNLDGITLDSALKRITSDAGLHLAYSTALVSSRKLV